MTFDTACGIFRDQQHEDFDLAADVVIHYARAGLSDAQVQLLAKCIAASGKIVNLPANLEPFVDVPSSGGPASLTTLLCPLVIATRGYTVPKLSATGSIAGGIDTLAIIPGYQTHLVGEQFVDVLRRCRLAHAEPSKNFCPADNHLVRRRRAEKMMDNIQLAAASLLAKKLAIPRTQAVFDFRVGRAGNIGWNLQTARHAKRLLLRTAKALGITCDVALTDNRTFPCSALGRIESLHLLWRILCSRKLSSIDNSHVALCLEISARACALVDKKLEIREARRGLQRLLHGGSVKELFLKHVQTQGGGLSALHSLVNTAEDRRNHIALTAATDGYWRAPDVNRAKEWLKSEQQRAQILFAESKATWEVQIGLNLCQTPGDKVNVGDTLIELRHPRTLHVKPPQWLVGEITRAPLTTAPQLLE